MVVEELFLEALKGAWWLLIEAIKAFEYLWKLALAPPITRFKRSLGESWREMRAGSWPRTDGRVEQVHEDERFTEWRLEIAYSYQIEGEIFSGYLELPYGRSMGSDRARSSLRPGTSLIVRYDRRHIDRAALLLSDQEGLEVRAAAGGTITLAVVSKEVSQKRVMASSGGRGSATFDRA